MGRVYACVSEQRVTHALALLLLAGAALLRALRHAHARSSLCSAHSAREATVPWANSQAIMQPRTVRVPVAAAAAGARV